VTTGSQHWGEAVQNEAAIKQQYLA